MRIIHMTSNLSLGGADYMAIDLARTQIQMGHSASICGVHGAGLLDWRAEAEGVPLHHLHLPRRVDWHPKRLIQLLRDEKADIAHVVWGCWLQVALACRWAGIPCVVTYHANYSRRWFLAHRLAAKFTAHVATLTPEPERYITHYANVPPSKCSVIPNGIDVARYESAPTATIDGVPEGAPVVGMIARMKPPKDFATYLDACAVVARSRPDVHFILAGDGPLRPELEAKAAGLGLTGRIHFLGFRSDVAALMKRLTVHVLSSDSEGMPISLLEAMAAGCPSVASDLRPIRWMFADGTAGRLFPTGDANALALAVVDLLDSKEKRDSLVARGFDRVALFTVEAMAANYVKIYEEVLTKRGRPGG